MKCKTCGWVWWKGEHCPRCGPLQQPDPLPIPIPIPDPEVIEPPILQEPREILKGEYLLYDCPWTLKDIIESIIEIYSIPLSRNQFIVALNKNSYITNGELAYEAAIQEKILQEQNGRVTKFIPTNQP